MDKKILESVDEIEKLIEKSAINIEDALSVLSSLDRIARKEKSQAGMDFVQDIAAEMHRTFDSCHELWREFSSAKYSHIDDE